MKNILALDLGMAMGYAVKTNIALDSGYADLQCGNSEGYSYGIYRGWLDRTIAHNAIDEVAIEDVKGIWRDAFSGRYYFGFRAITMMIAEKHSCLLFGYNQSTLKKAILGHGRADKIDAVMHARKRHPDIDIRNDDQADALIVLEYHEGRQNGTILPPEPKKRKKTRKKK